MAAETDAAAEPILAVRGVRRDFGGIVACDVEHLDVARETIVALIGPNGAGKTTLFNVLTGFERADAGSWEFEGREVSGRIARLAYVVARRGMVRTFQTPRVFPRLSVLDNVALAVPRQRGERYLGALFPFLWRAEERAIRQRAAEVVEWVGLGAKQRDYAGTLSGGQRKLLELARAVTAAPRLLMLDEPMAGVNPALTESLLDRIRQLPDRAITVVFVEHDMDVVSSIAQRVVCLAEGRVIADGRAEEVAADPLVVDAYLGQTRSAVPPHPGS